MKYIGMAMVLAGVAGATLLMLQTGARSDAVAALVASCAVAVTGGVFFGVSSRRDG